MASRDLNGLFPPLRQRVIWLKEYLDAIYVAIFWTCTKRSRKEQEALYAQGREPVEIVNLKRAEVRLAAIKPEQNHEVTWTLDSAHTQEPFSFAVDFALKWPSPWDLKADMNEDEIPDYTQVGRAAETLGLEWGGSWNDYPHIQWPAWKETIKLLGG